MPARCLSALVLAMVLVGSPGCTANRDRDDVLLAPGAANTVSFKVEGMACRNCAREIVHELMEVPGVRGATVNFDTATATVAVDPDAPASMESLQAAVEHWRKEHFGAQEDPNCLDPARRAEIKKGM